MDIFTVCKKNSIVFATVAGPVFAALGIWVLVALWGDIFFIVIAALLLATAAAVVGAAVTGTFQRALKKMPPSILADYMQAAVKVAPRTWVSEEYLVHQCGPFTFCTELGWAAWLYGQKQYMLMGTPASVFPLPLPAFYTLRVCNTDGTRTDVFMKRTAADAAMEQIHHNDPGVRMGYTPDLFRQYKSNPGAVRLDIPKKKAP